MIEVQSETRSVVDDTDDVTQDILLDSSTNTRSGSSFQESEAETIPAEAEMIPDLSQIEVSVMKGKNATNWADCDLRTVDWVPVGLLGYPK